MSTTEKQRALARWLDDGGSPPKRHDAGGEHAGLTRRESITRNVLGLAREVQIIFRDGHVVFGTVLFVRDAAARSFSIRPWGWASTMEVAFEDVARALPVREMTWAKERAIRAQQRAANGRGARGRDFTPP